MSQVITRSINVTIHQPGFDVDFGSYESDQSVEVILDHIIKGDPGPQGPSGPQGPEGPQGPSVQSDWNQTDNTALDFIKNKPTIPSQIIVDNALSTTSENPVQNKVVKAAIDLKSDKANTPVVLTVSDITQLTSAQVDALRIGDAVEVSNPSAAGAFLYIVTYKDNVECLLDSIFNGDFYGVEYFKDNNIWTYINTDVYSLNDYVPKSQTVGLLKNDGTVDTNTYLTQHQDISGKADKVTGATSGNFAGLDASGNLTDSGRSLSKTPKVVVPSVDGTIPNMTSDEIASLELGDIVLQSNWMNYFVVKKSGNGNGSEILLTYVDNDSIIVIRLKRANNLWAYDRYWSISLSNINSIKYKADKVANATNGNFAGLDSNGNLTDSGSKASDFIAMPSGGTTGQVLKKTANGTEWANESGGVQDVTVDGTSIVSSGTAVIVTMTTTELNTLWNSI